MKWNLLKGFMAWLLSLALLLALPSSAQAHEDVGNRDQFINGYHIHLDLNEPAQMGHTTILVRLRNWEGKWVTDAEVHLRAMGADAHSDGKANPHSDTAAETDHAGMDMGGHGESNPGAPSEHEAGAHDRPNTAGHTEDASLVLRPTGNVGEYVGELNFDKAGEWLLNVRFTVDDQVEQEAHFNVTVAGEPAWLVLTIFGGLNAGIIATAAVLRRKSFIQKPVRS